MVEICGIPGSLRKGSYNKALLRAAKEEAPDEMNINIFELGDIPLFNEDVEAKGDPEPVQQLKEAINRADAVLIATPEYQHSLPGVLKNALDWASRPTFKAALTGKIVGAMGASPSPVGTARAHEQLYQVLVYNQCDIVSNPAVLVANAGDKFEDGHLTDEKGRKFMRKHLEALKDKVKETTDDG